MSRPVTAHGVTVAPPRGWDVRIYRRPETGDGSTHAVLHAATFPLPAERGDFGSGAVALMAPDDVFVSLVEFHPDASSTAMFGSRGLPRALAAEAFDQMTLQRTIPGQSGQQLFFNHRGRAFCLYVVLGSHARRGTLGSLINQLLAGITIEGRAGG